MKPVEAQNDQIIAKVFWRSVLVLGVVAVGVVLVVVFLRGDAEQEAVEQSVSPPQTLTISVHPPQVSFTDVTQASGISFRHENGAYGERLLPETMGGGVAFLDVDNDGDQDLIFVNSSRWPWREETSPSPAAELYLNRGDGTFQPVTAGFDESLYGMGIATGDYDDDGYTDVFLSALGANRLYRNLNGERFEDVTDTTGVAGHPEQWSTSAAFFDFDRDGDLDLFVTNYVEWSRAIDLAVDYRLAGIGRAYGPPNNYALHPRLSFFTKM